MADSKANLLLHPVRLRIVTSLIGQNLTPSQLQDLLPTIPQASLYRQIKTLLDGGILEVTEENKVNGAIERSYRVRDGQERLSAADVEGISREEHLQFYNIFAASLIESATEYLSKANLERIFEEGFSYSRATIHLTLEEQAAFREEIIALMMRYATKAPSAERQTFTLASTIIPSPKDKK